MSSLLNIKARIGLLTLAGFTAASLTHAQQTDLRGAVKSAPTEYDLYPHKVRSAERHYAAEQAILEATAERMASLRDDDPLLADLYMMRAGRDILGKPNLIAVDNDMKRRGDVTVQILLNEFKEPWSTMSRSYITSLVNDTNWLKPEIFRPLVLKWYQDLKTINDPEHRNATIAEFIATWGYPEDEPILREILPDAPNGRTMQQFRARLERIKNGDTTSNPNLPPWMADRGKALTPTNGNSAGKRGQGTNQ